MESLQQLYNVTIPCFVEFDISYNKTMQMIFQFIFGKSKYQESDCFKSSTTPFHIGYLCLWVVLFIITTMSNVTVIIAIKKTSYLRENIGNFFILSLAMADFCVGIFIIPIKMIFAFNNSNFYSAILCRFYITTDSTIFSISVITLILVSLDRYMAVAFPYKYRKWLTMRRCKFVIGGIWMNGLIWGLLSNVNWHDVERTSIIINTDHKCVINNNAAYVTTVYVFMFYIPAVVMAVVYIRVLRIARFHARSISLSIPLTEKDGRGRCNHSNHNSVSPDVFSEDERQVYVDDTNTKEANTMIHTNTQSNMRNQKYRTLTLKATKTVATVYGIFFVCWFPVSLFALSVAHHFSFFARSGMNSNWFYYLFVEVLPIFNSMCNPFIYAIMNRQYRRAYKYLFSKIHRELVREKSFNRQQKSGTITSMTTVPKY